MNIKIYNSRSKLGWCIRISGRNNRVLLDASGYNTRRTAERSLKQVVKYINTGNYKIV